MDDFRFSNDRHVGGGIAVQQPYDSSIEFTQEHISRSACLIYVSIFFISVHVCISMTTINKIKTRDQWT